MPSGSGGTKSVGWTRSGWLSSCLLLLVHRLRLALYLELQAAQVSGEKAILGAHRERFPAACKCSAGFKTGTSEVRFLLLSCLGRGNAIFPLIFMSSSRTAWLIIGNFHSSVTYRLKNEYFLNVQLCAISHNEYAHGATQMSPKTSVASEVSLGTTGHRLPCFWLPTI